MENKSIVIFFHFFCHFVFICALLHTRSLLWFVYMPPMIIAGGLGRSHLADRKILDFTVYICMYIVCMRRWSVSSDSATMELWGGGQQPDTVFRSSVCIFWLSWIVERAKRRGSRIRVWIAAIEIARFVVYRALNALEYVRFKLALRSRVQMSSEYFRSVRHRICWVIIWGSLKTVL